MALCGGVTAKSSELYADTFVLPELRDTPLLPFNSPDPRYMPSEYLRDMQSELFQAGVIHSADISADVRANQELTPNPSVLVTGQNESEPLLFAWA